MRVRRAQHHAIGLAGQVDIVLEAAVAAQSSACPRSARTGCPIPNWPISRSLQLSSRRKPGPMLPQRSNPAQSIAIMPHRIVHASGKVDPGFRRDDDLWEGCARRAVKRRGRGMERIDVGGIALETVIAGAGPPLLFLHGGDYVAQNAPFLDRLARRWRVIAPRHPGLRRRPRARLVPHRPRHRLSLSRPARPPRSQRRAPGRLVVRRLDRARDGGALGGAARPPRADRLARASSSAAARSATSPTSMRCRPTRYCAASLSTRPASCPITPSSTMPSCSPSPATARRPRSTAGSPICTTRRWRTGCTGSPGRPWCCGAKRTASSRPPMASGSPPRCPTPASSAVAAGGALPADRAARGGRRAIEFATPFAPGAGPRDGNQRQRQNHDANLAFQRDGLSPGLGASRRIPTGS